MSHEDCRLTLYTKYETLCKLALIYGMYVFNEVTIRQDCCLHQL